MDEQELDQVVARVQEGEKNAFGEVVFAVQREVRIFLSAHASSTDMVEEVLQATLVACYENIAKYERRGTFLSWIKGIGRNLLLKELKARSRYVAAEADTLERIVVEDALASSGGEDREREYVEKLRLCLEKLPDVSRQLVGRRYYDRQTVKEIAEGLRRTETWAAVTLFRIRETLRLCMTEEAAL